jgi:hypothetical protein
VGFFQFLNHWFNLPYLVMLGLVAAFFLLQLVGLVGHDGDADVDHDVDADADGDADADADGGALHGTLSFLGVGRVPFMVVWGSLFIFAGFAGIFFTRISVRLAGKLVDTGGRGSARKHELVGTIGVVASATVDARFGEIRVSDRARNEMLVHARLQDGPPLARGQAVVLIDYDEGKELFIVEPSDVGHLVNKG